MENNRIINFEEIKNKIKLNIDSFKLYLIQCEGASNKIGYRIMGIQKGEIFKNRYYTRNLSEELFQKEIFEFF